jgi:hypothetical protein
VKWRSFPGHGRSAPATKTTAALRGAGRRTLIIIGETMIQTAISHAAFDAIVATMPLGSVSFERD